MTSEEDGLLRSLKTIEETDGTIATLNGQEYLLFCSNDYLGLAHHPYVIKKSQEALAEFGAGSGASPLICGYTILHQKLESQIAAFKHREAALLFSSGFAANLGIITSLVGEKDTVILDRLDHASLIDACRLSKARLQVYSHKDMPALEKILQRSERFSQKMIITDSVFSMDGDLAPLPEIVRLARQYGALTMIDEAHATGVLGEHGQGAEEHFGLEGQIDIIMGTLSKALGSLGGFAAGKKDLIAYLQNKARSYIYSTALPAPVCAASLAAFEVMEKEPEIRKRLWQNVAYIKQALGLKSETQIMPIIIGDSAKTMQIAQKLFEQGFFIRGIRPPTVPQGEARLRLTVSAKHTPEQIDCLLSALKGLLPDF